MPLSSYYEAAILGLLPSPCYVSLHTAEPDDTGSGEVSGSAYARQPSDFSQTGSNPTVASNDDALQYPQATGAWGTVTHFGIWDAASAGNFLGWAEVDISRDIVYGDIVRWEAGDLDVEVD